MIVLIQRVAEASVSVEGRVTGAVGRGLLALVCGEPGDTPAVIGKLARKTARLPIFEDEAGRMNRSVVDRELEKSEKKLRKAINDEKALQHQLKQLTRKERTHRLCTRGGMLESFLQEPERLTDDDVMMLLKLIFHRQDTQELLKKLLEREKPETP